jgi:RNA polymerase sigma-70 factor (ECF subfamily)
MKKNGFQNLIHFFSSTILSYCCNSFFHSFVKGITSNMSDQQELIKQVLQGNVKAQKELYDAHAEIMLGVCYRYSKSMADAEDMLQEGFVKVFRNLKQYKGTGDLGAWIRRIMVNTIINEIKKRKIALMPLDQDAEPDNQLHEYGAEIMLTAKEIAELIKKLPVGYGLVFNLHAIEGYAHKEIAEMLNIQVASVRSQYQRARTQLIIWIEKENASLSQKTVEHGK